MANTVTTCADRATSDTWRWQLDEFELGYKHVESIRIWSKHLIFIGYKSCNP